MAEDETRDPSSEPDPASDDGLSSADGFPEHPVVESSEFTGNLKDLPDDPKPKSSGGGSRMLVIVLIVVLAGGEFFLYQGQVNTRNEVIARLDSFQAQLNQFQQPPEVGMQNQQALKKLQQDFQSFQSKVMSDLGAQHETLEAVESSVQDLADRPSFTSRSQPEVSTPPETTAHHEDREEPEEVSDTNPKKDYIEFVESTGEKIFRLAREGATKLFEYFASLFE